MNRIQAMLDMGANMIERRNTTIEVETVPNSSEIRMVYPLVKELAIYWSAQKRSWFVSCRCNAVEAEGIKAMYADSISVNNVK